MRFRLSAAGMRDAWVPGMPRHARSVGCLLGVALACGWAATARAQPVAFEAPDTRSDELIWPGREHAWYDYAYTGTLTVGAALELFVLPSGENEPRRHVNVLFDFALHDEVVLGSEADRHAVATAADVMLGVLIAVPAVVDPAVVAWGVRGSPAVAWQMTMINLQAYAFSSLVSGVTKRVVDRARPMVAACEQDPDYDVNCTAADNHYSFPSGHASMAFTGAALNCLHHFQLDLYGGGAPDIISCATGVTMAAFTGISRMASDKHYASDVIGGALIGSVSGSLMPWLLYYLPGEPLTVTEGSFVLPVVNHEQIAVSWGGVL